MQLIYILARRLIIVCARDLSEVHQKFMFVTSQKREVDIRRIRLLGRTHYCNGS